MSIIKIFSPDVSVISLFISGKNLSNSLSKFHFILDALGLKLDTDMEILIHIGIDTVNMKGDGFKVLVKAGDEVKVISKSFKIK